MGVLDEIVANKREELQRLRGDTPQAQLESACRGLAPSEATDEASVLPGLASRSRFK